MAYNEKHLVKLADLKALGTKQKEVADALAARVDTLENVGSQANVLEGVKVNGTALAIANKMVDILIATGSKNGSISVNGADVAIKGLAALAFKAKVSQSDLDDALAAVLEGKADKATTLDGYGITNAYTKDEINAKISAVYKPAGSVAFAELPSLSESILGNVYNVTDAFTTTANFVEDAGNKHPKGTNVVVVKVGDAYKYDVLAGFVDLSGYVEKEAGKGLSDENFTAALKDKLDGIEAGANKYVHPTHTAAASGLYKTTVDEEGHVTDTIPVTKDDITGLGIPAQDTTYDEATTAKAGLMSAADKTKLDGIAEGANNYTHPSHTAAASGFYKVTVDELGHVTAVTAVTKEDITGLGIPGQDTPYQKATAEADGLMSKEHFSKVEGVAAGATKVEASTTVGNIKINGTETPVVTIATDGEVAEMLAEVFPTT